HYDVQIAKQLFELGIKKFEVAELYSDKNSNTKVILKEFNYYGIGNLYNSNKIVLIGENASGSNTLALYKMMPDYIHSRYDVKYIKKYSKTEDYYKDLLTSGLVVGTFGPSNYDKEQTSVELWHGFPLKGLGNSSKVNVEDLEFVSEQWNSIDIIASYSYLYNVVMSSSFWINSNKFYITGMPRNDFLFNSNGKEILSDLLEISLENEKVIFLVPTFRESVYQNKSNKFKAWYEILGIRIFQDSKLNDFLTANNMKLILKLHPFEEKLFLNNLDEDNNNIFILKNKLLEDKTIDLYEILNAADLLITDYSSVYFDYLLLNRPIIFIPFDFEEYRKIRGFLLEPYDLWTPGPKVFNQADLEKEILKSLDNINYYQNEREYICNFIHYYKDGNASELVWNIIKGKMEVEK
ncbi:MAG: hypothetical protein GX175_06110, partial [Halanaerobiaceae bacterium]|nr:hypothetical protein [Halanaerobiaceae bacterium]